MTRSTVNGIARSKVSDATVQKIARWFARNHRASGEGARYSRFGAQSMPLL
jgi:hypothetical protein